MKHTLSRIFYNWYFDVDKWLFSWGNKYVYKLVYKLTGRCGSLADGHTPMLGNKCDWLWNIEEFNEGVSRYNRFTCNVCGFKHVGHISPREIEVVPQRIKRDREEHYKDFIQPWRGDDFNKEFADAYPEQTKEMLKDGTLTLKQLNRAKKVYK